MKLNLYYVEDEKLKSKLVNVEDLNEEARRLEGEKEEYITFESNKMMALELGNYYKSRIEFSKPNLSFEKKQDEMFEYSVYGRNKSIMTIYELQKLFHISKIIINTYEDIQEKKVYLLNLLEKLKHLYNDSIYETPSLNTLGDIIDTIRKFIHNNKIEFTFDYNSIDNLGAVSLFQNELYNLVNESIRNKADKFYKEICKTKTEIEKEIRKIY